ncbi:MAG: DUF4838 domain-containing protein, partial [Victivallaceae bacterium]
MTANTRPAIKADIAGLLAGQATVTGQRHLQILKMLQAGGLESPNHPKTALKKFKAVLAPCGVVEKADIFNTALRESPETEVLWDLYAEFLQQCSSSKEALTCAEQTAISDSAENLIKKVQSQQKQSKTCLEKVEKLQRVIDVVRIKLEKREKKLGHCKILLGGKLLNPRFHAIVIPNTPSEPEKYAAKELQHHFELLTSQTLPVLKDKETAGDKRSFFVIGKSRLLKDFNIDVDWEKLGKDGIFIKASGPHLFLAGGQRGALYACYTLLEDVLQVHWLSPQCTVYPKSGLFSLASIEIFYVPMLEFRDHDAFIFKGNSIYAARNKFNGHRSNPPEKCGGRVSYIRKSSHTFYALLPIQKYFAKHPEYFSEVGGKRQRGKIRGNNEITYTQLCLSNPTVENLVVQEVKKWIEKYPGDIVSVTPNDGGVPCECAKCKAVDEEEGSQAGSLIRFVNRVAERIGKKYPNVLIDTFAYGYSLKPPKLTKPRSNVVIRIAGIKCSYSTPLETGRTAENRKFCEYLSKWGKIASRLHVWDYATNFRHYLLPHPNLRTLKPNIQFFIKNGVKGIFEAGNQHSAGGEFQELRAWLIAKLLWNPNANFEKLLNQFLTGFYGPAAPFLRKYIDLIHDSAEKTNSELTCYTKVNSPFLTPEILDKADVIFDRAENAVKGNASFLKRVQIA